MWSLIILAISGCFCSELIVTKEYTDYLKKHVSWEVADYEDNIFRGWSIDEFKSMLIQKLPEVDNDYPDVKRTTPLPSQVIWEGECIHSPKNAIRCTDSWAISTAGMLSDRCCIHLGRDYGWLSIQELVDCDTGNEGCQGGYPSAALQYVVENRGLVRESCYSRKAKESFCPGSCENGEDWVFSHVCSCQGVIKCVGTVGIKNCLLTGPIATVVTVTRALLSYISGIFKCQGSSIGLHSVVITGYSDTPECHWIVKNSWGSAWGDHGYFKLACESCEVTGENAHENVACDYFE